MGKYSSDNNQRCGNCKYLIVEDRGYSNYTVTDTYLMCLKNADDRFPCPDYYIHESDDPYFWGQECKQFEFGKPIHLDVDLDSTLIDYCHGDEQLKAILNLFGVSDYSENSFLGQMHSIRSNGYVTDVIARAYGKEKKQ